MNEYHIGNEIILRVRFANRFGVATNPVTVTGSVKQPDGTLIALDWTVTTTVGVWEATFTPTMRNKHWYSVLATGGVNAASEDAFTVYEQKVIA